MLTPRRLRGLAHPIRVRLLFLLETDGPATASQLGRRIGQSSGVTSYHLRILGELGFVEEDTARGNARDRWWRVRYRASAFTFRSPDDPGDPQTVEVAEQYMRIVAETYYERMLGYVNSLAQRLDELPTLPWSLNEHAIELTHDEARSLTAEVHALVERYRREPGRIGRRDGAVRAVFQFQVLPDDEAPRSEAPGDEAPGDEAPRSEAPAATPRNEAPADEAPDAGAADGGAS
jgi:DNA-binding transcriptional ArsR family regulator